MWLRWALDQISARRASPTRLALGRTVPSDTIGVARPDPPPEQRRKHHPDTDPDDGEVTAKAVDDQQDSEGDRKHYRSPKEPSTQVTPQPERSQPQDSHNGFQFLLLDPVFDDGVRGRDRDRAVERSPALERLDELTGLLVGHPPEDEGQLRGVQHGRLRRRSRIPRCLHLGTYRAELAPL